MYSAAGNYTEYLEWNWKLQHSFFIIILFFFNSVCQQILFLEEEEIIIEQDIDLSETSSAQVQNKGNENLPFFWGFWMPISIVEETSVVLVFRQLIVSKVYKRQEHLAPIFC